MRPATTGREHSKSSLFPPPPPPSSGRPSGAKANRGGISRTYSRDSQQSATSALLDRSATPTRLYRTSSRGDVAERNESSGRIFRTSSRDSSGAGDRIFRTPSKDASAAGASGSRFDRSYRTEGKPPTATAPSSSRTATKQQPQGLSHARRPSFDRVERHQPEDSGSVASDRENTDRGNVRDPIESLQRGAGAGTGAETPGKMVHHSSFWDQAANALNDLASTATSPTPTKSGGGGRDSYYGRPSDRSSSSGQSRGAYESARSSGRGGERRDDVSPSSAGASAGAPQDTSNMPSVSSDSPTVLYSLIRARNWAEVAERCRGGDGKGEAGTWVVERNANGTVRWRLLPLHQACEMQPPEDVVKALIVAYPPAVQMKDSGGDLPLHLACRERATKDVVHTLLRADPSTAGIADDEGRLPLHLACRQGAGLDIVDDLLETHHRGAKTADSYGLLPLHWACAQNATVPIVESLLRAHPYAVDVKDKWGRTPLSLAHASTNADKSRIVSALGRDASYWTTSLKNEVEDLRGRLETSSIRADRESEKASGLEAKLAEVMKASSEAALSFQNIRSELEEENTRLREEVADLGPRVEQSEERIRYLEERDASLRDRVAVLAERLGQLTDVFRDMEDQRLQVLRVTGEWEESLHRAAELVLLDDEGEEE